MSGHLHGLTDSPGRGVVALRGVAHVLPTRNVLAGFAPISVDNRRVVLQEWLVEAVTMWGIAALVVVCTVVGGGASQVTSWFCRAAATAGRRGGGHPLTGADAKVIWFKICPVLLTSSAVLLLFASLV